MSNSEKTELENALTKIIDDLKTKPSIVDVSIHHMVGTFSVGEDLVYVTVAGKNRKDVFSSR